MSMNALLAQHYGTASDIGNASSSEQEKLAQAQVLDTVLRGQGVRLNDLSDDMILKVANELYGPNNAISKLAEDPPAPPPFGAGGGESEEDKRKREEDERKAKGEETMEEKVAEADFLGRVMAHALWQESKQIEKQAGAGQYAQPTGENYGLQARVQELLKQAGAAQQPTQQLQDYSPQEKLASAAQALAQVAQMLQELSGT